MILEWLLGLGPAVGKAIQGRLISKGLDAAEKQLRAKESITLQTVIKVAFQKAVAYEIANAQEDTTRSLYTRLQDDIPTLFPDTPELFPEAIEQALLMGEPSEIRGVLLTHVLSQEEPLAPVTYALVARDLSASFLKAFGETLQDAHYAPGWVEYQQALLEQLRQEAHRQQTSQPQPELAELIQSLNDRLQNPQSLPDLSQVFIQSADTLRKVVQEELQPVRHDVQEVGHGVKQVQEGVDALQEKMDQVLEHLPGPPASQSKPSSPSPTQKGANEMRDVEINQANLTVILSKAQVSDLALIIAALGAQVPSGVVQGQQVGALVTWAVGAGRLEELYDTAKRFMSNWQYVLQQNFP